MLVKSALGCPLCVCVRVYLCVCVCERESIYFIHTRVVNELEVKGEAFREEYNADISKEEN
jgi:hypothetical protein